MMTFHIIPNQMESHKIHVPNHQPDIRKEGLGMKLEQIAGPKNGEPLS